MTITFKLCGLWVLAVLTSGATPQITSIVNAASYTPSGLPNSGVAQGSLFVVLGTGLGPTGLEQAAGFPLPTNLAGTSMRVTVGETTVDAIMVYTQAKQAAAILPSNTPTGIGLLAVTYAGHTSQSGAFRIMRSAPGILTQDQSGSGLALAENFNSETDQPRNSLTRAAHPGQLVTLWGTGWGPISAADADRPAHQDLGINLQVLVGGKPAAVRYKGRADCCGGVDQAVFEVPRDVEGCYVPVAVRVDDAVSNYATISVASTGTVCSDLNGLSGTDLEKVANGGAIAYGTISLRTDKVCNDDFDVCTDANTTLVENGFAEFVRSGLALVGARVPLGLPALGSCLVSGSPRGAFGIAVPAPVALDAGPELHLSGPKGVQQVPLQSSGRYFQTFSSGAKQAQYLVPGSYTVDNGNGGLDVGPFRASLTIPAPFTPVVRSLDRQVTWSGGDAGGYVLVQGSVTLATGTNRVGFVCTERVSAGRFTVPPEVLLSLPLAAADSSGLALSATSPVQVTFRASGLDLGQFSAVGQ